MSKNAWITLALCWTAFLFIVIGCGGGDDPSQPETPCPTPHLTLGPVVQVDSLTVSLTCKTDSMTVGRVSYTIDNQNYYQLTPLDTIHHFVLDDLEFGSTQTYQYSFRPYDWGCPLVGTGVFETPRHPAEDVAEGWQLYSEGSFFRAANSFALATAKDQSFLPALAGLGWVSMAVGEPLTAYRSFSQILRMTSDQYDPDTYAGMAFALAALYPTGNYVNIRARFFAGEVLAIDPEWTFVHDSNYNSQDLVLLLAQTNFLDGQYSDCLQWLQELDPTISLDPLSVAGIAQMATLLEYYSSLFR